MSLRIGFLMDPVEEVQVHHDTTFGFMLSAQSRGHEVRVLLQEDLFFQDGPRARMRTVRLTEEQGRHVEVLADTIGSLEELDVLFLRKDPPVDAAFTHATQMVELCRPGRGPVFMNEPAALRDASEKLYALRFPELCPRTMVARSPNVLSAFVDEVGGEAVLKPVDGFAGRSVFLLKRGDRNLSSLLETATAHGRKDVVVQQYLPASREGDKRVLLLDGEPLGAVLRVPREDDVRANMAAGGTPAKTGLSEKELEICRALAPDLVARGLHFVGIDLIGERLIEVNVTSPTGVREVEKLDGVDVSGQILALAEKKAAARNA